MSKFLYSISCPVHGCNKKSLGKFGSPEEARTVCFDHLRRHSGHNMSETKATKLTRDAAIRKHENATTENGRCRSRSPKYKHARKEIPDLHTSQTSSEKTLPSLSEIHQLSDSLFEKLTDFQLAQETPCTKVAPTMLETMPDITISNIMAEVSCGEATVRSSASIARIAAQMFQDECYNLENQLEMLKRLFTDRAQM